MSFALAEQVVLSKASESHNSSADVLQALLRCARACDDLDDQVSTVRVIPPTSVQALCLVRAIALATDSATTSAGASDASTVMTVLRAAAALATRLASPALLVVLLDRMPGCVM
jgi:hypothetical protein